MHKSRSTVTNYIFGIFFFYIHPYFIYVAVKMLYYLLEKFMKLCNFIIGRFHHFISHEGVNYENNQQSFH